MQTYDRLVVYSPRPAADARDSQHSRAHASSSSERHLSSSQERSPHERKHQPFCSSREPGTMHAQSRSAGERAQPESSTARHNQPADGHVKSDAIIRGEHLHGRSQRGLGGTEPDLAPNRKRRRFFSVQPPAEPGDQSRSCNGYDRPSERSREGVDGAQCSSEVSQQPARSSVAVRCNGHESRMPPSGRNEEVQPDCRDEVQCSSNHASKLGTQSGLHHSKHWRGGSARQAEASSMCWQSCV